jgi:hypothetical protein
MCDQSTDGVWSEDLACVHPSDAGIVWVSEFAGYHFLLIIVVELVVDWKMVVADVRNGRRIEIRIEDELNTGLCSDSEVTPRSAGSCDPGDPATGCEVDGWIWVTWLVNTPPLIIKFCAAGKNAPVYLDSPAISYSTMPRWGFQDSHCGT